MTTYVQPLPDYHQLPETESCYLDGRYFNMVFKDYPGLIKEPLIISIRQERDKETYRVHMKSEDIGHLQPGFLRLIIETPTSRHSNLLILDYQDRTVYRFEPLGPKAPYFDWVNQIIKEYLDIYFDFDLKMINEQVKDVTNPNCQLSGYCMAYVILFGYSLLSGEEFDPSDIRRFTTLVEKNYGPLTEKGADIEMGLFGGNRPPNAGGALVGGLAGGTLGGLAFGGPGLLIGGLGGAALGSTL